MGSGIPTFVSQEFQKRVGGSGFDMMVGILTQYVCELRTGALLSINILVHKKQMFHRTVTVDTLA